MIRHLLLSILLACAVFTTAARAQLRAGDTVALCGDSITEQRLYSVYLATYLLACQPAPDLRAHQFGWSGESAPGLANRIDTQVLPFQPTVATTLYGMNDGGYVATDPARRQRFEQATRAIIAKLKAGGVRHILVGSPGVVDSETFKTWRLAKVSPDTYNATLADLGQAARAIAESEHVAFVDVHGVMLAAMQKAKAARGPDFPFAKDGVHPEAMGHLVMACAFLKALGCDGEIGTLAIDLAQNRATATDGHRVVSCAGGTLELESTRYPFVTYGSPGDPAANRAALALVPFDAELNRLRLVVRGATPAARYTVAWGASSRTFTGAALAAGINLPAEFPDNPFSEPFKTVQDAVRRQQEFETPAVKNMLNSLPGFARTLPEAGPAYAEITAAVVAKSRALAAEARASVKPVQHRIQISLTP